MRAVLTIAWLTFLEARRKRVLLAAGIGGALLLVIFSVAFHFVERSVDACMHDPRDLAYLCRIQKISSVIVGLYVTNFLSVAMAVLLPLDTMSGEIASGMMQSLVTKPIRRAEILGGKYLTCLGLVGLYQLVMAAAVLIEGRWIADIVLDEVSAGLALMVFETAVLVTVVIAGGTSFRTVTNGIVSLGFYAVGFVGGWIGRLATMSHSDVGVRIGTFVDLISPADVLWRLAAYHLQPPLMRDMGIPPLFSGPAPNMAMVWWASGFVVVLLIVAILRFERQPL